MERERVANYYGSYRLNRRWVYIVDQESGRKWKFTGYTVWVDDIASPHIISPLAICHTMRHDLIINPETFHFTAKFPGSG